VSASQRAFTSCSSKKACLKWRTRTIFLDEIAPELETQAKILRGFRTENSCIWAA